MRLMQNDLQYSAAEEIVRCPGQNSATKQLSPRLLFAANPLVDSLPLDVETMLRQQMAPEIVRAAEQVLAPSRPLRDGTRRRCRRRACRGVQ